MTDETENNLHRRIDDRLPAQPLQWEDRPEEARQLRAKEGARLAGVMASAAADFLAHMGTGGAIAAIPNTDPCLYVVAGTMEAIGHVLGKTAGAAQTEQTRMAGAAKGGITSLEGLARYRDLGGFGVTYSQDGEYVKFSDVEKLFAVEKPTGDLTDEQIEASARAIYDLLPPCQGVSAKDYPWQPGGNSMKQDEARRYARAAIAACLASQPKAEPIADLTEFTERSIRDHADFRDDIERLSTADSRTRKVLRKEIYDTIDARVRNAVKVALAATTTTDASAAAMPVARLQAEVSDRPYSEGETFYGVVILDRARCFDGMELYADRASAQASQAAASDEVRNQALEEAAQICDSEVIGIVTPDSVRWDAAAKQCAERIRAQRTIPATPASAETSTDKGDA